MVERLSVKKLNQFHNYNEEIFFEKLVMKSKKGGQFNK